MSTDPDGHSDMFATRHNYWRDALAPGPALDSLTMNFLRFLEIDFANVEHGLRNAPNKEKIGWYHSSVILLDAESSQFPSSSGVVTEWVSLQPTHS
jgi:hypothetical protein